MAKATKKKPKASADAAPPRTANAPRSALGWFGGILMSVRDDIAKDWIKEGVKAVAYSAVVFILGGGVWWGTALVIGEPPENPSGYSLLAPIIYEATRNDEYGVRWEVEGDGKPNLAYCERYVSQGSDGAEHLEQFGAQFPGCLTTERRMIGGKEFILLGIGEVVDGPVCLGSDGEVTERLFFCQCNQEVQQRAKENRLFLAEPPLEETDCR